MNLSFQYVILLLATVLSRCHSQVLKVLSTRSLDNAPLGDLTGLFSKDPPFATKYNLQSCEFEVAKDGCKLTFLPKDESCKDTMSLGKLTKYLLKSEKLKEMLVNFIPLGLFQIERFYLDKCKGNVEFEAVAKESFEVIRERIKVKSAKLLLDFNFLNFTKNFSFKDLAFELNGEYEMFGNNMQIVLSKQQGSDEADLSIVTDSIKMSNFISLFKKKKVIGEKVVANLAIFTDATIQKPTISGTRDSDGSYEIVLKGHLSDNHEFEEATVYILAQKLVNEPTTLAIVIDIKNINPGTVISALTNKDFNRIPLLKESDTNVIVEYASRDITIVKDTELNRLLLKYISDSNTIVKGEKLKIELPIKKIIQKQNKHNTTLRHIPKLIYVQVFFLENKISVKFPDDYRIRLDRLLPILVPKVPKEIFKSILLNPPRVMIKKFDIYTEPKAIDMSFSAPKSVALGDRLINLQQADFKLSKKSDQDWDFSIKGTKKIEDTLLTVDVMKVAKDYVFQGKIKEMSLRQIANHFGGGLCANETFDQLSFLDVQVKDLVIIADFYKGTMKLSAEGKPQLFGWDAHFEGFIMYKEDANKMAFGIVIKSVGIAEVSKKFFNQSLFQAKWIPDVTVKIVISNANDCEDCGFMTKDLMDVKVRAGAFLTTTMTIPETCSGDAMCDMLKDKMRSGTSFSLDGEIATNGFLLRAPYKEEDGLSFGMGLMLEEPVLCVEVGENLGRVYVEGEVKITDPRLRFNGSVELSPTGMVELQLIMIGRWKGPMRLKNVHFDRVEMGMGITPGKLINKLELSGMLYITGNFTQIIAYSTIGLSVTNPLENYFYADIAAISLPTLLSAFNVNLLYLPEVLYRAYFPQGLVIGSTGNPEGKRVDHLGVKLEMGLVMKGMINVLDLKLQCKLAISARKRFDLTANMSVLHFGDDMISVRRSEKEIEEGPLLHGAINLFGARLKIGGYVEVLGIGSDTVIDISNGGVEFKVYGNLFNVVDANLTVMAPYFTGGIEGNLSKSDLIVSSSLSGSIKDVAVETIKQIIDAAEFTDDTIKETEEQERTAQSWYNRSMGRLDKWTKKMKEKEDVIQDKSEELDNVKTYLSESCTDHCKKRCVGGFSKTINCTKLFGEWISCPVWNECKKRLDDPFCLAKCQGTKMYLNGKGLKKKTAMQILNDAIDIIQKMLDQTKEFVTKAKRVVDLARIASDKMELVAESGKRALEAISEYSKENLISISNFGFNTSLGDAADSCIEMDIAATLGSEKEIEFSPEICLDNDFVKNAGIAIADRFFPQISSLKEKLNKAKEYLQDAKNEAAEMETLLAESDALEKGIDAKVQEVEKEKEHDERLQKKDNDEMRRKSMKYIHKQIYSDLPAFIMRDDEVVDSFKRKSPWAFSLDDSPFTEYINTSLSEDVEQMETDPGSRSIDNLKEETNDTAPCSKAKDAVNVFSQVSDTIALLVKKTKEMKQSYQAAGRVYSRETSSIEKEIASNSQMLNLNSEEKEEAMFYVEKLKDGVAKWMKNLDKQVSLQDKESISSWRRSLTDIVLKKNMDMKEFLKMIDSATDSINKRHVLNADGRFGERLLNARRLMKELLRDDEGTLYSKRNIAGALVENVLYLKEGVDSLNCAGAA